MSYIDTLLGQHVTWTVPVPPLHGPVVGEDGVTRWVATPQPPIERSGVVWSPGPVTGSAWVIPDEREPDEGHAVCVKVSKTGHTQDGNALARSDAEAQERALSHARHGLAYPALFARGHQDGCGAYPHQLLRGDGTHPIPSFGRDGIREARGTCRECGQVRRVMLHKVRGLTARGKPRSVLSLTPVIGPHAVKGTACPGAGQVPAETRYTPGRELASWEQQGLAHTDSYRDAAS